MWLANRFPSVKRLLRENADLKARLSSGTHNGYRTAPSRDDYKSVWNDLGSSMERATMNVYGSTDEGAMRESALWTRGELARTVGINADDVILEIGCGIGRVGEELSHCCREWIGCDVS